jgi:hypothetical protein
MGTFERSTDAGASYGARTSPLEAVDDEFGLLPADGTDDSQDCACVYGDVSANELSLKMYDDSGNSWTEKAIGTYAEAGNDYLNWDAMMNPLDGLIYVVWCTEPNAATADLKASTIAPNAHPAADPTAKTNVLTDTQAIASPRLLLDNTTGSVYCFYLRGTLGSDMDVFYKKSTDGMATWGSEVQFSIAAGANLRNLSTPRLIRTTYAGRVIAAWTHDTDNDLLTNVANSIEIEAGTAFGGIATAGQAFRLAGVGGGLVHGAMVG